MQSLCDLLDVRVGTDFMLSPSAHTTDIAMAAAQIAWSSHRSTIFDLVNETDKKERLEAIFLEGKNLESGSDDAHETSINLLQLIEQLDLKDRFSSRFKVALAAVAKDWKDREALVKIYEGRIDII